MKKIRPNQKHFDELLSYGCDMFTDMAMEYDFEYDGYDPSNYSLHFIDNKGLYKLVIYVTTQTIGLVHRDNVTDHVYYKDRTEDEIREILKRHNTSLRKLEKGY